MRRLGRVMFGCAPFLMVGAGLWDLSGAAVAAIVVGLWIWVDCHVPDTWGRR